MRERNAVEGGFGICKRRYGLARIMARLKETAESIISLQFLVMNLEHRLRLLYYHFLRAILEAFESQKLQWLCNCLRAVFKLENLYSKP
ncbi:hypothetical protein Pmgp_01445 [Pelotomaculum propionicicum]|uniref:Transposase DDE domain-containing protein n=1 Tax=Pelotomaculum propionicicum TaxID=258475 RepID=A0A4Y7RSF2_9FIRM|nr:hypothetical protein Pmgp_01445 [Pelotomaculum propionicicum]